MSSGYINAILRNMNPYAQWAVSLYTPSGITIPEIIKLINPMAISIHAPSGNINTVILI